MKNEAKYLVIEDRTDKVIAAYDSKEEAISWIEGNGYEHHSGWTYRNPMTRSYCHVADAETAAEINAVVKAAKSANMTVDAYLQI